MPFHEEYEVTAETMVTVKKDGQVISSFKTFGACKGNNSNGIKKPGLHEAINRSVQNAAVNADFMGDSVQQIRERENP